MLPDRISLLFSVHSRQLNRAFALDEPHHLRHRVFGWNGGMTLTRSRIASLARLGTRTAGTLLSGRDRHRNSGDSSTGSFVAKFRHQFGEVLVSNVLLEGGIGAGIRHLFTSQNVLFVLKG